MTHHAQPASSEASTPGRVNDFDDSRIFWLYSSPAGTAGIASIDALTDRLYGELFQRNEMLTKQHLWLLLRDLAVNWLQSKTQYLAVHLNKNRYCPGSFYHYQGFKYDPVRKVITTLAQAGFIEIHAGFFNRDARMGRLTRIKAAEKLIEVFDGVGVRQDIDAVYPVTKPVDPIEIRDQDKLPIQFVPTTQIKSMIHEVARYNDALEGVNIDVTLDDYLYPVKIDLTKKFVRRIFNNSSIDNGGRLAGAWWLSCPSDVRSRILINYMETVELDLKALHPILLYAEAGIDYFDEMGHDPYSVCDVQGIMGCWIPPLQRSQFRNFFKQMFLVLINNIDEAKAKAALRGEMNKSNGEGKEAGRVPAYPELSNARFELYWDLFKSRHQPIAHCFAGGGSQVPASLRLMRIDSDCIMRALMKMLDNNVVCLSVHDSLIIPFPYQEIARSVIVESFYKTLFDLAHRPVIARCSLEPFYKHFQPYAMQSHCEDKALQARAMQRRPIYVDYIRH